MKGDELKKHKLNIFPEMSQDEYSELKNDLESNGYDKTQPIYIYENQILDGWNRQRACDELNIKPVYEYFTGSNIQAIEFVMRTNKRRNLTSSQLAALAVQSENVIEIIREQVETARRVKQAETLTETHKNNMFSGINSTKQKEQARDESLNTRTKVAKAFNTNPRYIDQAKKLKEESPETFAKVLSGEKTLTEINNENKYKKAAEKAKSIQTQNEVNIQESKTIDIKIGDIYLIKKENFINKLIIWDSFDVEYIKKELPENITVLTDPPYGISYKSPTGSGFTSRGDYNIINGDEKEFNPNILFEYSDKIITWGANHYANKLPNSAGWLVWDKREGTQLNNNSDCELAWTNILNSARLFHHKWNGMIKASEHGEKRIHPTQKPIKLFSWCLDVCEVKTTVLDMFAGSGVTLIASNYNNLECVLVENDPSFAAAQIKRFERLGYEIEKK